MERILLIESDPMTAELESDFLQASGFETKIVRDGKKGCELLLEGGYDGAVLDAVLPGKDGLTICREVRERLNIPLIIVSSEDDEIKRIRSFHCGADDYLVRPYSPSELAARMRAHIRIRKKLLKNTSDSRKCIQIRNLKILPNERRVYLGDEEITLVNKEFELLLFLAENPNIAFSRDQLYDRIWGMDANGSTATVTVHINRLREKIDKDPLHPMIDTVWSVGYRFHIRERS